MHLESVAVVFPVLLKNWKKRLDLRAVIHRLVWLQKKHWQAIQPRLLKTVLLIWDPAVMSVCCIDCMSRFSPHVANSAQRNNLVEAICGPIYARPLTRAKSPPMIGGKIGTLKQYGMNKPKERTTDGARRAARRAELRFNLTKLAKDFSPVYSSMGPAII